MHDGASLLNEIRFGKNQATSQVGPNCPSQANSKTKQTDKYDPVGSFSPHYQISPPEAQGSDLESFQRFSQFSIISKE